MTEFNEYWSFQAKYCAVFFKNDFGDPKKYKMYDVFVSCCLLNLPALECSIIADNVKKTIKIIAVESFILWLALNCRVVLLGAAVCRLLSMGRWWLEYIVQQSIGRSLIINTTPFEIPLQQQFASSFHLLHVLTYENTCILPKVAHDIEFAMTPIFNEFETRKTFTLISIGTIDQINKLYLFWFSHKCFNSLSRNIVSLGGFLS